MGTITDQLTEIYCFVDDFLKEHPRLENWRQSHNCRPLLSDAEVITIGLMQGCLGVATMKQTHELIAQNHRDAFPHLCCYTQWMNRLHSVSIQIGALLSSTCGVAPDAESLYLVDSMPIPMCHPLRHGRVRLLREDGAWFGKTSKGWFFGFKLHVVCHVGGRVLNLILSPGNWSDRDPVLALFDEISNAAIALGDAAYSEANCAEQLTGEELDLLLISRQDISKHWKYLHSQVRQRVETCFSLLWNRFIQRVFSRSWLGLWNTIQLKVNSRCSTTIFVTHP